MEQPLSPKVEKLLQDLQSGQLNAVRIRAATELGKLDASDLRVVEALVTAMESGPSAMVRERAAESLDAPAHQEILQQHPDLMTQVLEVQAAQRSPHTPKAERKARRDLRKPHPGDGEPPPTPAVMTKASTAPPGLTFRSTLPTGAPTSWFQVWKRAITRPSVATFAELVDAPDADSGRAYRWIFVSALASALLALVLIRLVATEFLAGSGFAPPGFDALFKNSLFMLSCYGPVGAVGAIIVFAVWVGIIQGIAHLLSGTGDYADLTYAFAAFHAPLALVGAVFTSGLLIIMLVIPSIGPIIGLMSYAPLVYHVVLSAIAVKAVHQFGWAKAAAAVLLPCIGLVALLVGLGVDNPYTGFGSDYMAIKHYNQGIDYTEEYEFDLAIQEFTKAIEHSPQFVQAYSHRGIVYAVPGVSH